jgi:hypothetical protein
LVSAFDFFVSLLVRESPAPLPRASGSFDELWRWCSASGMIEQVADSLRMPRSSCRGRHAALGQRLGNAA